MYSHRYIICYEQVVGSHLYTYLYVMVGNTEIYSITNSWWDTVPKKSTMHTPTGTRYAYWGNSPVLPRIPLHWLFTMYKNPR